MPLITVSQLNNYMKRYIDKNIHLSDLWIKGEVSNFKIHYSGHIYMTLKDDTSNIKAVMFNSYAEKSNYIPNNGDKVIAFGKVSVYERDGVYQLYVESLIPDGVGELYATYEKLKNRLEDEGLFDIKYKKSIPKYPKCIGVVSSISGAALRDIMNVISRRYNLCDVCIYPVKVQGLGAADTICEALEYFSVHKDCDVVILARGGGSIEDLWAYNEEKTARAIFKCTKPVISGIGHETDYTISDFVSDLRAPTPSAAAELATPSESDLLSLVYQYSDRVKTKINANLNFMNDKLLSLNEKVLNVKLNAYFDKLNSKLDLTKSKLSNTFSKNSSEIITKLTSLSSSLNALSPKKVLQRGYSIVCDENNNPVSADSIGIGDTVNVLFDKGKIKCNVVEVYHEK